MGSVLGLSVPGHTEQVPGVVLGLSGWAGTGCDGTRKRRTGGGTGWRYRGTGQRWGRYRSGGCAQCRVCRYHEAGAGSHCGGLTAGTLSPVPLSGRSRQCLPVLPPSSAPPGSVPPSQRGAPGSARPRCGTRRRQRGVGGRVSIAGPAGDPGVGARPKPPREHGAPQPQLRGIKMLVRVFLALLFAAALSVLYVLLCRDTAGLRVGSSYTAPAALSLPGYSRVPDGQPLRRAPCRRCAVVSSSGQMLGSHLGREIDGQECVLRMNHAPTAGFEDDVGTRSTVRVVSHTSVPLLLRNQPYFFQQSRDTIYVIWGPSKKMNRDKGGPTYRALLRVMERYPQLQLYTLTEEKMAYCDDVFQNETGKNRMKSGSFLSTGWFTMILAMELCEHICVFGMVSDSYCREKNHSSVPYHYFEKGRLDECRMYLVHERAPRAGHRFITEKAIFSRWAKRKDIIFTHPSWAGG